VVAVIHWIDRVESTNRIAQSTDFVHGDVIATLDQTAGRGRMDRVWTMAPGAGVALTIVVSRAALGTPTHMTRLPLCVAVELARIIAEHASAATQATVKWPNDVLIDGRKVAGILIESLDPDRLAIGIGINVSGSPAGLPPETVTSLSAEGVALTAATIVPALAEAVIRRAQELDDELLLGELTDANDTVGRQVQVELPDGRFVSGLATGLGSSGSLIVDTANGAEEFVAGDVTHIRLGGDELVR
jgi:BirA family biotin operon repressor/biotin-[acetyl-CoA-carboxylase] ligase